ncbi:isomerase [Roseobacter denitrificans]|nr:TIM barrel protein [Roseobacter denitrificans]AVL54843.1 isomerase [Roseobacter denitrificans]SFG30608.1 hydroxypyruvate isomerase [Roseobacter denitrificans OCh 114]
MQFSANLGFLWTDRTLPEAIHAAKAAGFDAVECHWPYGEAAKDVVAALDATGLPMLGLNTLRGNLDAGENGLSALPGREGEARAAIDQAIAYARATGAQNVHVMAGFAQGVAAENCFVEALEYACEQALPFGITILIEPLNHYDAPGYFLSTTTHAKEIITRVGAPNLKLMFDCYHVQLMEGDLSHKLAALLPVIGHIQFARVPDRGPPAGGEVNYAHIFGVIEELGWHKPLGAEYKSPLPTDETLGWMTKLRN